MASTALLRGLRLTRLPPLLATRVPSRSMALIPKHLPQEIHKDTMLKERRVGQYTDENYVNPYAGGPTAIDKAVHFFFLTEILRGKGNL